MSLEKDRHIVSIQVGKTQNTLFEGKALITAFRKQPMQPPIYLTSLHFIGDEQADLEFHGGPDKAVCVYLWEHYAYWEKELDRTLLFGAFGENLTVLGMPETEVCLGDIYQIGDALVQVSQPRQPCHKLAKRHHVAHLPLLVQDTGFTGFYFRVLREGWLGTDLQIRLVEPHPLGISVSYANHIHYKDKANVDGLRKVLAVDALSESWQKSLGSRLL